MRGEPRTPSRAGFALLHLLSAALTSRWLLVARGASCGDLRQASLEKLDRLQIRRGPCELNVHPDRQSADRPI